MEELHITVPRTARYHTLGDPTKAQAIWIVLHGYGHLARFFLNEFEGLEEDKYIVAPEGLSRFYIDKAHTRVGATWMTREDRDNEMADQITYLDQLAMHLRAHCPAKALIHCMGFSQGVAAACRWAANGKTDIKRLVLWGGSMPPELDHELLLDRWSDVHVDLVHGDADDVVPESVLLQSQAKLRAGHVDFGTTIFSGGHALEKITLHRMITW